jgi:hypothetical protein
MNNTVMPYLSMIIGTAPMILVYIAGIIVALIYWGRAPKACGLVLSAMLIFFFSSIAQPVLQTRMILQRGSPSSLGQTLMVMAMFFNVIRAAAMALLIWAAFADRPELAPPTGFEPLPPRM